MRTHHELEKEWEETTNHWIFNEVMDMDGCRECFGTFIKGVQLEAYQAGLTRAADIAKLREDGSLGQTSARANIVNRILAERDNKTAL